MQQARRMERPSSIPSAPPRHFSAESPVCRLLRSCGALPTVLEQIPGLSESDAAGNAIRQRFTLWRYHLSKSHAPHMGYVPSIKLSRNLELAKVGIWLDIVQDNRVVVVCKMPETVIRALSQGAGASLVLSTIQAESFKLLCLALKVQDEPESPFAASMPKLIPEEKELLCRVFLSGSFALHCINELNHAVLSISCTLPEQEARAAADAVARSDHWLLTPESAHAMGGRDFMRVADLALNEFADKYIYSKSDAPISADSQFAAHIPSLWRYGSQSRFSRSVRHSPRPLPH